jgi:hypothetical protein
VKVHYVDIETQLKRIARNAAEHGHAIDYVELTLVEACQLYDVLPASIRGEQSRADFLTGAWAVYATDDMDLTLRWKPTQPVRAKDGTLS